MDQITDDKLARALWEAVEYLNLGQFIYGENFDELRLDAPQWIHLRSFMTPEAAEATEKAYERLYDEGETLDAAWRNDSMLSELVVESPIEAESGETVILLCLEGTAPDVRQPGRVVHRTSVLEFHFQSANLAVPLLRGSGVREVISTADRTACGLPS